MNAMQALTFYASMMVGVTLLCSTGAFVMLYFMREKVRRDRSNRSTGTDSRLNTCR